MVPSDDLFIVSPSAPTFQFVFVPLQSYIWPCIAFCIPVLFVVYRSTREAVPTPDPGSLCVCIMRALRIVRCAFCGEFRYLYDNQITEFPADVFSGLVNLQEL